MASTPKTTNAIPPVNLPITNSRSGNTIKVHAVQKGNPVLNALKHRWEYANISADYQLGTKTCALYLSLKYHRLKPDYIYRRIKDIGDAFMCRILILQVDEKDPENEIKELTKACLINNFTIMVAFSTEDATHYLKTYKDYEYKAAKSIQERVDNRYDTLLQASLKSIKGVNKTDVITLKTRFGSFAGISKATLEELSLCPGVGPVKAKRIREAFNAPFFNGPVITNTQTKGKEKARASPPPVPNAPDKASDEIDPRLRKASRIIEEPEAEREGSPAWDIDLDLNSDPEEQDLSPSGSRPNKKRKPNPYDGHSD